jgi:hypothetical protein
MTGLVRDPQVDHPVIRPCAYSVGVARARQRRARSTRIAPRSATSNPAEIAATGDSAPVLARVPFAGTAPIGIVGLATWSDPSCAGVGVGVCIGAPGTAATPKSMPTGSDSCVPMACRTEAL